jgi:hypothetical protein
MVEFKVKINELNKSKEIKNDSLKRECRIIINNKISEIYKSLNNKERNKKDA